MNGPIYSSPAVANGEVLVATESGPDHTGGSLYAFDAAGSTSCSGIPKTCAPLWTASVSGPIGSSLAVANGVVYFGTDDHKVYAFDAAGSTNCSGTPRTCVPLWTAATGASPGSSAPAVANGVVYIGSDDHSVYAFDAAGSISCSGTPRICAPLWAADTGAPVQSSPAVAGGIVYVSNGEVFAFGVSPTLPVPTVTPVPGITSIITFVAAPVRLADTRTSGGAIASGSSRCFPVTGLGGIPAYAGAVVLNVTAVGQTTNGWLTVYPSGQSVPATSTVNFGTSAYAMANGTIMRVGPDGQVCIRVGTVNSVTGSAQVILDATGFIASSALTSLPLLPSPVRLADTRASGGPIPTGAQRCFQVAGLMGIPGDAAAVILNVTADGYATLGWLTAYPYGQPVPATSTVNFDPSEYAMANNAIVRVGSGGQVCVDVGTVNSAPGSAHVILDATGYLTAGAGSVVDMLPSPQRVADTRQEGGAISTGTSRCFNVDRLALGTYPTNVIVNVTAIGYGTRGWLTVYPQDQPVPATSTLNFDVSEYAVANGVIVRTNSLEGLCVSVGTLNSVPGSSHVVLDVVGYFPPYDYVGIGP